MALPEGSASLDRGRPIGLRVADRGRLRGLEDLVAREARRGGHTVRSGFWRGLSRACAREGDQYVDHPPAHPPPTLKGEEHRLPREGARVCAKFVKSV